MRDYEIDSLIRSAEVAFHLAPGAVRSRNKSAVYAAARRVATALILDYQPHITHIAMAHLMGFRDHTSAIFYRRAVANLRIRETYEYAVAVSEARRRVGPVECDAVAAE